MTAALEIGNLTVSIDDQEIVHDVDLRLEAGEIHAIMGPNGSGKSTMAAALAGHPEYLVNKTAEVKLNGENVLGLSPDERAQAGLFLAFQYPVEIPGIKVQNFLRQAYEARFAGQEDKQFDTVLEFRNYLKKLAKEFSIKPDLLERGLNEGFSGGERKRLEILQMAVLEPQFAVLDETDSGLDVDAIKQVAAGVKQVVEKHQTGMLVITHYQRILEYLEPDFVHVMKAGKISQSGGPELAEEIEAEGYEEA